MGKIKILDSKSYCAICGNPLEINNIGAVIIDGSAQNACQDPCVITYILQIVKPVVKINNILPMATGVNERQYTTPVLTRPPAIVTNDSFHSHSIITSGELLEIETLDSSVEPITISYTDILAEQIFSNFAIIEIEFSNTTNIQMRINMKTNNSELLIFTCYLDGHSAFKHIFDIPLMIANKDLIIEFKHFDTENQPNNTEYAIMTKLIGQIV